MAQQQHPIFDDITRGDLKEVQRWVRADAAVLEERDEEDEMTPLIYAICDHNPAIALWLIEHRGQHDLDTSENHWEYGVPRCQLERSDVGREGAGNGRRQSGGLGPG